MNKTKLMALSLLATCAIGSPAIAADAPPPPAVVESWTCSYLPGKDVSDIVAARDYYQRQADKAGVEIGPAFMWSLVKGDVPIDAVWLAPHQNLAAWAASVEAEAAADELADVQARFYSAVDCTARLGTIRQIFAREGAQDDGDGQAFISALACGLHDGVGPAGVADLHGHMAATFGGLGEAAPNLSYSISPVTGGPNTPDMVMFNVFDGPVAYANFVNALFGDGSNASLGRHLRAVADCNIALWDSTQMLAGPE